MLKRTAAIGMLFFMLLGAGGAKAGVWSVSGAVTIKGPDGSVSSPVTAVLTLADDRTYRFDFGEGVPDTGAWFEVGGKFTFYTQNLLEQIEEMEGLFAEEFGEPAEVTPLGSKGKAGISSKTGLLSLQNVWTYLVYFPNSDATARFQLSLKATGTPM